MTDSAGFIYIYLYIHTYTHMHACLHTCTNNQRKETEAINLKVEGIGRVEERGVERGWREEKEGRK